MITGPMLFEAQNGQWIEQVCRIAAGLDPLHKPEAGQNALDQFYNFIDVRDLVKGHRLAAESSVDHKASLGGNRYLMHGGRSADGRSAFKLSTDVREILLPFLAEVAASCFRRGMQRVFHLDKILGLEISRRILQHLTVLSLI